MAWLLSSENSEVALRDSLILGRANFPNNSLLSRKHLQFFIDDGQLFVVDLGSTNGTLVDEEPISANQRIRLVVGQSLQLGDVTFKVRWGEKSYSAADVFRFTAIGIFASFLSIVILMPGLSFGRALGWDGLLITCFFIAISAGVSSACWRLVFWNKKWSRLQVKIYAGVSVVSAVVLIYSLVNRAQAHFQLSEYLMQNKVEFFCLKNFNREMCVTNVNLCPTCALKIDKWKRNLMLEKLSAYTNQFPPEIRAQYELIQKNRQPASR